MEPHYYNVEIKWDRDRKGVMCSPEISKESLSDRGCVQIATPPEFPKGIAGIWSPEHLFTASVSSCLMTTFLAIAENSKLDFTAFSCKSRGKLEMVEGKYMMTEVMLVPHVTLTNEDDRQKAERIINKSGDACLISNSVKSRVWLSPMITVDKKAAA